MSRISAPFDPYMPKEYYKKKFFIRMTVGGKQSIHDNSKKAFIYYATTYPELLERYGGTENVFRVQMLASVQRKSIKGKTVLSDFVKLEKINEEGKVMERRKKAERKSQSESD